MTCIFREGVREALPPLFQYAIFKVKTWMPMHHVKGTSRRWILDGSKWTIDNNGNIIKSMAENSMTWRKSAGCKAAAVSTLSKAFIILVLPDFSVLMKNRTREIGILDMGKQADMDAVPVRHWLVGCGLGLSCRWVHPLLLSKATASSFWPAAHKSRQRRAGRG